MPPTCTAVEVLDRDFLTLRARLIEVAALLDRLDRAPGDVADDPRRQAIARSLAILASPNERRTEQVQMTFSLPYDPDWRG